jgi:hypothetical protein
MARQHDEEESNIFGLLADAHPREVYEAFPERYRELFHRECPDMSREEMEKLLEESDGDTVPQG